MVASDLKEYTGGGTVVWIYKWEIAEISISILIRSDTFAVLPSGVAIHADIGFPQIRICICIICIGTHRRYAPQETGRDVGMTPFAG